MDICTALQQGCSGHPCFADANMNQATSMGSKEMEMKMGVHQLDIPELSVYYIHTYWDWGVVELDCVVHYACR